LIQKNEDDKKYAIKAGVLNRSPIFGLILNPKYDDGQVCVIIDGKQYTNSTLSWRDIGIKNNHTVHILKRLSPKQQEFLSQNNARKIEEKRPKDVGTQTEPILIFDPSESDIDSCSDTEIDSTPLESPKSCTGSDPPTPKAKKNLNASVILPYSPFLWKKFTHFDP
jgi:hypothetical protein